MMRNVLTIVIFLYYTSTAPVGWVDAVQLFNQPTAPGHERMRHSSTNSSPSSNSFPPHQRDITHRKLDATDNPTGHPTRTPSSQPTNRPTSNPSLASLYTAIVDTSKPDAPLTANTDYSCGQGIRTSSTYTHISTGTMPTTSKSTWKPCSLRAALVYCLTRRSWRGDISADLSSLSTFGAVCTLSLSPPMITDDTALPPIPPTYRIYPDPLILPVTDKLKLSQIIIDGNGWVLEPGYGVGTVSRIFTGMRFEWFAFPFLTTSEGRYRTRAVG